MKNGRKILALLFAVMIIVSSVFSPGMTSLVTAAETLGAEEAEVVDTLEDADETESEKSETESASRESDTLQMESALEETEDADSETVSEDVEDDKLEIVSGEMVETEGILEETLSEETESDLEDNGKEETEDTLEMIQHRDEAEESESDLEDNADAGISVMSLLPLEEINAYLTLNGYSKEDLEHFPVIKLLEMLQDSNGNKIKIAENATTVWKYIKDEESLVEEYESYTIADEETMDIYPGDGVDTFQFEIIIGRDGQLNSDNKRYIVRAYLADNFEDEIGVEIYVEDEDSVRQKAVPDNCNFWISEYSDGTEELNFDLSYAGAVGGSLADQGTVWLNITSELANNPRVTVEIYPVIVYGSYYITVKTPLAEQILNQPMENTGTGYQISGEKNTDVTFQIVTYVDGEEYSTKYIGIRYWYWYPVHEGTMYTIQDGSRVNAYSNLVSTFNYKDKVTTLVFEMESGYDESDEYYFDYDFVMQKNYGTGSSTNNDIYVTKVVRGHYDSVEEAEAAGAEDISDDIVCGGRFPSGKGYLADYSGEGIDITVFKVARMSQNFPLPYDTLADKITIKVIDSTDEWKEFTDSPIIGESDPWFRVTGAVDESGEVLDTYVIENGKNTNIDTMYSYGYQTVFINDSVNDIQPAFWLADSDQITVQSIYVNGKQFNAGDLLSFADGENTINATFSVVINDSNGRHTKNYNVSFVKKTSGPQLYVAGPVAPEVRSVFLDEYFEYKHDIFIANVGDEPLTDLRLELNATNAVLDSYWTIGGEGNDTLAACPENFSLELDSTSYGELSNVAKIRLVPDGEEGGEIEGTLKIYSGDELLSTINLSGRAQNPEIITSEVEDAVRYVPYSYLVTTNNMYDWTDVQFSLEGELPEGVEFYPETGEIYGVPLEIGDFTFTVTASFTSETYSFQSSSVELTLTVKDNTDYNVYTASDDSYSLLDAIGTDAGNYDFVLEEYSDQIFRSEGELGQFVNLWLNGELLEEGVDYEAEEGSTKITIYTQTFENKADKSGRNTIAAEFRTKDTSSKNTSDNTNEMKRTAQNFRVDASCSHTWDSGKVTKAATCTENGVRTYTCTKCSATYTKSIPATGHSWDSGKVTKAATCTESGVRTYTCTRCSATKTEAIAPTGHKTQKITIAATCTTNGSIVTKCTICGTVTESQAIPATGHSYDSGKITKAVTCTDDGVKTYTCKKCGETYTEIIKAAGHNYVAEITKEATETEDGLRTYRCTICGDYFTEIIPAEGDGTHIHTYDEGIVTKEATCTELGEIQYTCTQCSFTKTEVILATGHDYEQDTVIKEATCTENGTVKYTCKNCNDSYTAPIVAMGHDYDEGVVTKEPTYAETGIRTYTCRKCGEIMTEVIPVLEKGNNGDISGGNSLSGATGTNGINDQDTDINTVTCNVRIVEKNSKALNGLTVELHSSPQMAVTNANGIVKFKEVEFGSHTIYLKDSDGTTLASKSFRIVSGQTLQLNGDIITAVKGSAFTLTIQYDEGELILLSVEESISPKTGDFADSRWWIVLALASIAGILIISNDKRKLHSCHTEKTSL